MYKYLTYFFKAPDYDLGDHNFIQDSPGNMAKKRRGYFTSPEFEN